MTLTGLDPTPNVRVDNVAPNAPAALDLDTASDTGSSGTDNITFDTTPTINGTGEIGATVTLTTARPTHPKVRMTTAAAA